MYKHIDQLQITFDQFLSQIFQEIDKKKRHCQDAQHLFFVT